jgi:DNA repair protein RadC
MTWLSPEIIQGAANATELAERLRASGPEGLDDLEALQAISGASPTEIAALLDEFGSLPEVLAASPAAMGRFVRPAAAGRLALTRDLGQRMLRAPLRARPVLSSSSALADYLRAGLAGRSRERFHVLYLDKKNCLIRDEVAGEGTVDHAPVYPREVLRRALELDASALILAHNHPAGDPTPSAADIEITRQVVEAARALRIAVHDHVVVGGQSVASFRALGLL